MQNMDFKHIVDVRGEDLLNKRSHTKSPELVKHSVSRSFSIFLIAIIASFLFGLYVGFNISKEDSKVIAKQQKSLQNHSVSQKMKVIIDKKKQWEKHIDIYKEYNIDRLSDEEKKHYFIYLTQFKKENSARITIGYL